MPGTKLFEKFEVIECLKKDGSAAVYLANHIFLGKKIILKALNTQAIYDESVVERFKREAKILAKFEHPNIIKVLDFGMYERFFYISFEYFESKNLREFMHGGTYSYEQKKHLLVQLFHGLSDAHANHIIHRDIKPENIFVNESLHLKLGDFGLALSMNENFVTNQYSIVGTPCYMSPEQIQGEKLSVQSDLFSAGIVAFELFTNKNPFLGSDVNESINNILNFDERKKNIFLEELPEEIRSIIQRLLRKNPVDRYANANEVLLSLNEKTESLSKPIPAIRNGKKIYAYAFAGIALGIMLLYIFLRTPEVPLDKAVNNIIPPVQHELIAKKETVTAETKKQDVANIVVKKQNDPSTQKKEEKVTKNEVKALKDVSLQSSLSPVAKLGELHIECLPWAFVYIDSIKTETTPLSKNIQLSEGTHKVWLVHPDFPRYERYISISSTEVANIKLNMEMLLGYLDCKVFPWGEIFVDGLSKGQTPLNKPVKLFPGEHSIVIKNTQFKPFSQKIMITQSETLQLKHKFEIQ